MSNCVTPNIFILNRGHETSQGADVRKIRAILIGKVKKRWETG